MTIIQNILRIAIYGRVASNSKNAEHFSCWFRLVSSVVIKSAFVE